MSRAGESIASRWQSVQREIEIALSRRPKNWNHPVKVLAVSKGQPVETILEAVAQGLLCFGENYVQEALAKQERLLHEVPVDVTQLEWHFIGHLQRNKVSRVIQRFHLIQSIDRPSLVVELERQMAKANLNLSPKSQRVLIEVNLSGEPSKAGVSPQDLESLAQQVKDSPYLILDGLMTMPPHQDSAENSRPYFKRLAELKSLLEVKFHCSLPHLSMGTSQDYAVAIEEGASIVRLGSILLGERQGRQV